MDIVRHQLNHWQPEIGVGPRGPFTFNGNKTALRNAPTGTPAPNQYNAFAAFLLGMPSKAQKSLQYEEMTTREWQLGFYFRDRWQVNRNLTLTLGMRYELYPIVHRADRGIERIDLDSPCSLRPTVGRTDSIQVLIGDRGGNPSPSASNRAKRCSLPVSALLTASATTWWSAAVTASLTTRCRSADHCADFTR